MDIKVAVASHNKTGTIGHAGKCQNYYIYTIDEQGNYTKELKELEENQTLSYTFHDDKSDNPQNYLFNMDIIIVTMIGQGGLNKLANQNVRGLIVKKAKTTDETIDQLIAGTLKTEEAKCHKHGHHKH
ncbi:MAG TPA: hypothetical protein EYP87_05930 [Flavobacteriaceae bacterium]|nr:hypothetical protein [Flavobacteriaceae bacterium]